MKILTISIAAYNAGKYINKCLDSLVKSSNIDDLDIIVVNDGSKDKTSEMAHLYEKLFKNSIRVIDKENGGHGSTINSGIQYATGKYFRTLDSDDTYDTDELDNFINALKNCDEDLVLTNYHSVSPDGNNRKNYECLKNDDLYDKKFCFNENCDSINVAMHAFTYKTEILKRMKERMDEHCFYVDVEYTVYPLINIFNCIAFSYDVYCYVVGYDEQSVNIKSLRKNREQHKKVTLNLIDYYERYKQLMQPKLVYLEKFRICEMILTQYSIYFSMAINETLKEEFVLFDKSLKEKAPDLYDEIGVCDNKIVPFIKRLRKAEYKYFSPQLKIRQMIHHITTD